MFGLIERLHEGMSTDGKPFIETSSHGSKRKMQPTWRFAGYVIQYHALAYC